MNSKKTSLKVAVTQSNYIPWKGYFDLIHDVDLFVFYDDVQFTKNDWRNRNKIKTPKGRSWLSVPVGTDLSRLVCEVKLPENSWAQDHWRLLNINYSTSPYFKHYSDFFENAYLKMKWLSLSELNQYLIKHIAHEFLGIKTEFSDSRKYSAEGKRLERLLNLLQKIGATHYISGPAARTYIIDEAFVEAKINLIFKDYSNFPEYPQFHPPFCHDVTILDLLFHCGPKAADYIWGWR